MPLDDRIDRMMLFVLRWEGDDELHSLLRHKTRGDGFICQATDSALVLGQWLNLPLIEVDGKLEKEVTEDFGRKYDGSAPSHDEVISFIVRHPQRWKFNVHADL